MTTAAKKGTPGPQGHDRSGDSDVDQALDDVQDVVDKETAQGFRGVEVDSTPNEAYTATGDASKTPEAQADPVAARHEATNPATK